MAAHLERVARELARELGTIMEAKGYDWAHLQDGYNDLLEPVAAALAACAREEREKAYAAICQLCEAQIPLDANGRHTGSGHVGSHCYATLIRRALERAVGEKG